MEDPTLLQDLKKIILGEEFKLLLTRENQHFEKQQFQGDSIPQKAKRAIQAIVSKNCNSQLRNIRQFFKFLNQARNCHINIDYALQHLSSIKFLICSQKKLYNFQADRRAFAIAGGKTISVYKRKKKLDQMLTLDERQARQQFATEIERSLLRLYVQNKMPIHKWERSFSLSDHLLQFQMPEKNLNPVFIGNEVFSPFAIQDETIIMTLPEKMSKTQNFNFVKSTTLHPYLENSLLLNKIMQRQSVHAKTTLKGIIFVEEGQVQVASGRVVARGWVINGLCKSSGVVWKFKPMPFIKFLAQNDNVWKQFFNDIKNNEQYPFDLSNVLNLNEEGRQVTNSFDIKQSLSKKRSQGLNKKLKLPQLRGNQTKLNFSLDEGKYQQMQKLRHYDEKINDIFYYKQDLLNRKLKGQKLSKLKPLMISGNDAAVRKRIQILQEREDKTKRKVNNISTTQNVLIISVLKKLENIAGVEQQEEIEKKQAEMNEALYKLASKRYHSNSTSTHQLATQKSQPKITPLQQYHQQKKLNQMKRHYFSHLKHQK